MSAITSIDPGKAFVLFPDELQDFTDIAGPGTSFTVAGYPVTNKMPLKDGWIIYFRTGDREQSAFIKQNDGTWYWVSPEIWKYYMQQDHGPDGKLGYPVDNQRPFSNGVLQDFQHGSLFYRADVGVLPNGQYDHLPAQPTESASQAASQQPATQPQPSAQSFCDYAVSASTADGAQPIVIEPGGSIQEEFKPPSGQVTGLYTVIGLDPKLANLDVDHDMTLVLWSADEKHHWAFQGVTNQADNNGQTSFGPALPISLPGSEPYYLQLINESADPVGVYAKPESSADRGIAQTPDIIIREERLYTAEHPQQGWALSGCIETR